MQSVNNVFKRCADVCVMTAVLLAGCKKFVQVPDPSSLLGTAAVFSGDAPATAAILGLYSRAMSSQGSFLNGGNTLYPALSADECILTQVFAALSAFSDNKLESSNTYITNLYGSAYNVLYNANIIIENLENSSHVTAVAKRQLMGEALFVRALVYSRLVVLWGAIPLITGTDADKNAVVSRQAPDSIYHRIMNDLQGADSLLDTAYAWAGIGAAERTRPNKWAARALAARADLYRGLWDEAADAATAVIDSGGYQLEMSLDSVFLKGSREAIWQLQPVSTSMSTAEGYYFMPVDNGQSRPAYVLTSVLLNAFETGDRRRSQWVGAKTISGITYLYPARYKVRAGPPYTEYNMVLRLAELYLVRAEARVEQGKPAEAVSDLNLIRSRAGLSNFTGALTRESVLAAVAQERRVEFFSEWGHRWSDLKRWGEADTVLSPRKPKWTSDAKLYPLPLTEMQRNPALVQNPGY